MKLKITSNGTIAGTKVTHAETGEMLSAVQAVTLNVEGTGVEGTVITALQEFVLDGSFLTTEEILYDFVHWLRMAYFKDPASFPKDMQTVLTSMGDKVIEYTSERRNPEK